MLDPNELEATLVVWASEVCRTPHSGAMLVERLHDLDGWRWDTRRSRGGSIVWGVERASMSGR